MSEKRQKNQIELAFTYSSKGEALRDTEEGTEALVAKVGTEDPTGSQRLMEAVCETENLKRALRRVKANKGSPGVDGIRVDQLPRYLIGHWKEIREELLSGTYNAQPVRRVEIPKADGGKRALGIPTAMDRFVQQAVLQVLQEQWDPTFSIHSHGFRPEHSQHGAIAEAQQYQAEGYGWVVDLDLEKFFDRVNHDRLMSRLAERISDKRMLKLIGGFLRAGWEEGDGTHRQLHYSKAQASCQRDQERGGTAACAKVPWVQFHSREKAEAANRAEVDRAGEEPNPRADATEAG